jgi:hypothetical protein
MTHSRTMTLPLAGKRSLREELESRNIAVIDDNEVRRIQREFVRGLRAWGPVGLFFQVVTNPLQGFIAIMAGLALTITAFYTAPSTWMTAGPALGTLFMLALALVANLTQWELAWVMRNSGAHWRRAPLRRIKESSRQFFYNAAWMFSNNQPGGIDTVPQGANRIIDEASNIPGARVEAEY